LETGTLVRRKVSYARLILEGGDADDVFATNVALAFVQNKS
jgi:hypothetical protein